MIDFHCHLDLYPNPLQVARDCAKWGIYVLSVTTTPSAWTGTVGLAEGASRIRTALGLHPQLAHQRKSELGLFEQLLPQARYVGEIGLDGSPECRAYWEDQITVFGYILSACVDAGGRVLSIHSRRAASAVLDKLEAQPAAGTPVLHWFSGTIREMQRAIKLGCWFSIGPAMLASEKGRALTAKMPPDRIVTETDGPFAQIDGNSAFPWDCARVVPILTSLWDKPPGAVEEQLRINLRRLTRS